MRRLVAISKKPSKALMAIVALTVLLTSIHMAASARISALKRQQEIAISTQRSAFSQNVSLADSQAPNPVPTAPAGPAHKRQIVISIADRKLAVLEDGQVLKMYPIAVGTSRTPSPDGDFVIVNRAKDPTYRHKDKEIAPGKDNPLGSRWMGLSLKGYGIHGTNVQSSIGKAASHGCFRMRKQDVEELYSLMQVGDTVTVRRERDAMIARVFSVPAAPAAAVTAKTQSTGEEQVASAVTTTGETNQQ